MDWKIGEIRQINDEWYQCIEGDNCRNCDLEESDECSNNECRSEKRKDNKPAIFKKLEKVGEPFTVAGKLYQHYKVFDIDNVCGDVFWCVHNYKAKTLTIEIKRDKEDMEEKKLNLKPFDLEEAKEGKPVCTRDGRKARIICFDRINPIYPICALVTDSDRQEKIWNYHMTGKIYSYENDNLDLMMLPEKKE